MSHDSSLQQAVLEALNFEPSLDAAHIGVAADGGVVTLTGHVSHYAQKRVAEAAAAAVRGVKAVVEEIEVKLPFDGRRSDEEIAVAAIHRLAWDAALSSNTVKVTVEHGWVTLTGDVGHRYLRELAQEDVRGLRGVVGVSNLIGVTPAVRAGDLGDAVNHALHRSWFFDPELVRVRVDGSKVILEGTVRSPHDRRLAAATAWNTPGVTEVENDLVVA